ncbi:uncharacterized protein LOC121379225 [Gigantopelta aegis]|uniref:uncharacterized protein LOC121379225 n=1 Tax=Gigantopelta aegis TaxID=1735272 RepID=UPI001B888F8D|nr:uncharacterized protein LOC121379225 [Gigantopelta aegis]
MTQEDVIESSPVTARPQPQSFRHYVEQQQQMLAISKHTEPGGPKLWRQMVIGFICAACVGFIMFILGGIFITEAVQLKYSATIMLCVMGMVCGLIIIVGTIILGKLFISRKWRESRGQEQQRPPAACFHTCSVIYTPSQDQLTQVGLSDPPPAYESIVTYNLHAVQTTGLLESDRAPDNIHHVMILPPKYDDISAPLPEYKDTQIPLDDID